MKGIKIAIIGSGCTYTPELIEGLIKQKRQLFLYQRIIFDGY